MIGLILSLLFSTLSFAQDGADLYISGTVKDYFSRKKISGATVRVLQDGKNFESQTTSGNGKYEYFLPLDHKYTIIFEKAGMVSKKIEIDSKGIPVEDRRGGFAMNPDMSLFETIEGIDFTMLDEPIGIGRYDPERGNIEFDVTHTQRMQAEIMRLMREVEKANEQAEKEEDKEAEALAKLEEDFEKLMEEGRKEMSKKDFQKAIDNFRDAVGLKPDNADAKSSLADAQKALDDKLAAEEAERKYNEFIDRGDNAFGAKNWTDAVDAYRQASEVKPDEKYPKDQLAKAEEEMAKEQERAADEAAVAALIAEGDNALGKEDFDTAISKYQEALGIIPDNKEAQDKLADAEKAKADYEALAAERAQYEQLISEADALFNKEDFQASIAKYEAALAVMKDEVYPKDRIAEAQDRIAALEAAEAEAAELAAKQAEFDRFMSEGQAALSEESFDAAIESFENALGVLPDNAEAQKKLEEARSAKEAFLSAQEADARYATLISDADALFDEGDWAAAIPIYEEALKVKDEAHPKDRIAEAERLIEEQKEAEEEAERLAAQEAELAAKQAEYDSYMAAGMGAMSSEEFESAISKFDNALGVFPEDANAQEAKQRAEDALAALLAQQEEEARLAEEEAAAEAARLEEEARLAAEAAEEEARQAEYKGFMAEGEEAFNASSFDQAIQAFERALGVIPEDAAAIEAKARAEQAKADKLSQMEADARAEAEAEAEAAIRAQYEGYMEDGRQAFDASEFEEAIEAFKDALSVIPDDAEALEFKARAEAELEAELARQAALAEQNAAEAAEAEKMAAYEKAMRQGDDALDQDGFEDAIASYEEALGVIPGDEKAQESIARAEQARDQFLAQQAEEEALAATRAAEQAEAQQAQAMRDRFNGLVSDGDAAMSAETFSPAIDKYTEALSIFPDDGPTQKKLQRAEKALADKQAQEAAAEAEERAEEERLARLEEERRQAEKEAANREAQAELDRQYDEALREGDRALADQSFLEAQTYYEDALDIKQDEAYPVAQIEKIAQLMAQAEEEEARRREREAEAKRLAEERGYTRGDDLRNSREEEIDAEIRAAREEALKAKWASMAEDKEAWQRRQEKLRAAGDTRTEENSEKVENYQRSASERAERFGEMAEEKAENMKGYKEGLASQAERKRNRADENREENRQSIEELADKNRQTRASAYGEDGSYVSHQQKVEEIRRYKAELAEKGKELQEDRSSRRDKAQEELLASRSEMTETGKRLTEEAQATIEEQKERRSEENAAVTIQRQLDNVAQAEALREDQQLLKKRLEDTSLAERQENLEELRAKKTFNTAPGPMDVAETSLAKEYPQGVTEEIYDQGNKSVIRRVVVVGNKANEYRKVQSLSGTYYFKNGQSITEYLWKLESDKVLE